MVYEQSTCLICEFDEQRLKVVFSELVLVIELQDVFQLLVSDKSVLVFVNCADRVHDLNHLVVTGDQVD